MSALAKVAEIERKLCLAHAGDPYMHMLSQQVCAIARSALAQAEDQWPRHDKRRERPQSDLFSWFPDRVRQTGA